VVWIALGLGIGVWDPSSSTCGLNVTQNDVSRAGSTAINGGSVQTTGAQSYNDAVTLGANTILAANGGGFITLGGTVDTFIEMVFNYPTLSEMFKYAAYDALSGFARASTQGQAAEQGG